MNNNNRKTIMRTNLLYSYILLNIVYYTECSKEANKKKLYELIKICFIGSNYV